MTTWENTDNENVIVTSDEAFERVTSDEHFEDEWERGYLQQNTSWLVQEIPNISFLDIWDTLLEQKKTLFQKNNWSVVVWKEWKSIEVIPQDTFNIKPWLDISITTLPTMVALDSWTGTQNSTVIEQDMDNPWRLKILKDWYYRISYWWTIEVLNATELIVSIVRNTEWVNKEITGDHYKWITSTILSGWRTIWCSLLRWDYVSMWVSADDSIKMLKDYSYLEIQYVRAAI